MSAENTERDALADLIHDLSYRGKQVPPGMARALADCILRSRFMADLRRRERAAARAEALGVAGLLLRKVAEYWDGRPVEHHGHHIYADLLDVLRGIEADEAHNRADNLDGGEAVTPLNGSESYPESPCPEHGPMCTGQGCCCRDKHRPTPPASTDGGPR